MSNSSLWKKYGEVLREAYGQPCIDRIMETIVRCKYCGVVLVTKEEMEEVEREIIERTGKAPDDLWYGLGEATVDHVIPQSLGGTDDIENLVPCCRTCNSKKGNRNSLTVEMNPDSSIEFESELIYRFFSKVVGDKR